MRKTGHQISKLFLFFGAFMAAMIFSTPSFAQAGGDTVGASIDNLALNFRGLEDIATIIAYLLGLGFAFFGIIKFIQHVDNPRQVPIIDPIKMLIAGGLFLGAPAFAYRLIRTFSLHSASEVSYGSFASGGGDSEGSLALDQMILNFVQDISGSMMHLFSAFSYIAGLFILLIAIYRITKGFNEGARGPVGLGTGMHFLVAAVLLSAPNVLGLFSETFFGTSSVATYANLSFMGDAAPELQAQAEAIMSAIVSFMIIIGIISFLRGWFILKSAADGNSQATMMSAFTHIIAGVLAVNIGPLMNAVQASMGISAYGVIFGG